MLSAPAAGVASLITPIPAQIGAPKRFFAMDGQCFAFLPVIDPSDATVQIYRSGNPSLEKMEVGRG